DTTTMVMAASGTVHGAGWVVKIASTPDNGGPNRVTAMAAVDDNRPTETPQIAPAAVSFGHQMPSTSSGENVDAATVKPQVTSNPASSGAANSASTTTAAAAASTVIRSRPRPPGDKSCAMAPDTASSRPSEVARKAAKAPAVSSVVNSVPRHPSSTCSGIATTAVSAAPDRYRCGTSTRPRTP